MVDGVTDGEWCVRDQSGLVSLVTTWADNRITEAAAEAKDGWGDPGRPGCWCGCSCRGAIAFSV